MRRALILAHALILLFYGVLSADETLSDILEGIRKSYGSQPGFRVDYTREVITRSMSMMGNKFKGGDLATGEIYFKPPYSLRLEQLSPRPETIITDGDMLWWYIPEKRQAYEYTSKEFGKELKLLSNIFRGLSEIKDNFQVVLLDGNKEEGWSIQLAPDPPWNDVESVVLTVEKDNHIRVVEIHNLLGGLTRFTLGNLRVKEDFDEGFFHFVVPAGVKLMKEGLK
jgi:outer membrane lipoprotein-sorting protein